MKIDHIGYAVRDLDKALKTFVALGYTFGEVVNDTDRNIKIVFGEMDGYRVELVAPLEKPSPVDTHLSKIGPTPYHICYKSNDFEGDIQHLQENKLRITIPPAPAVAFGGKRVVFMYSLSIGLIEIVEE